MAKVLTFSTVFPSYHPKKGQPTKFVEKILNKEKLHTIRSGNRWKAGDVFSPRVWAGKPYNSKQEVFHGDIIVKKVWNIKIKKVGIDAVFFINDKLIGNIGGRTWDYIAENDGLSSEELYHWFEVKKISQGKKIAFEGQIICWDETVEYIYEF